MALPADPELCAMEGPPWSARMPATVLIVDDEPLIRMVAAEAFADAGFMVREAATGEDALEILVADRSIDALFTDINMPGRLDGLGLAQRARCSRPHLAVVVTSGRIPRPCGLSETIGFLAKPYSPDAAAAFMRGLVEGARAEAKAGRGQPQRSAADGVRSPASAE